MFVSNHPMLVKAAKICYEEYPTIVNDLAESGLAYGNKMQDYARMDIMMSHSQLGIGWSSNVAQLCMSYYWTELDKQEPNEEYRQGYYVNFIILSVLAQIIIDGCKRVYQIDGLEEIKRILREPCMVKQIQYRDDFGNIKTQKKDFPLFMKYTRDVPVTKNGEPLPYELVKQDRTKLKNRIDNTIVCPMNWLQDFLNKIQGVRTNDWIPTEDFFVKVEGRADWRTTNKILDVIKDYSSAIKRDLVQQWEDPMSALFKMGEDMDIAVERIKALRFKSRKVINRLVQTALDLEGSQDRVHKALQRKNAKYSRQILNCLYRSDKQRFLENFIGGD